MITNVSITNDNVVNLQWNAQDGTNFTRYQIQLIDDTDWINPKDLPGSHIMNISPHNNI